MPMVPQRPDARLERCRNALLAPSPPDKSQKRDSAIGSARRNDESSVDRPLASHVARSTGESEWGVPCHVPGSSTAGAGDFRDEIARDIDTARTARVSRHLSSHNSSTSCLD